MFKNHDRQTNMYFGSFNITERKLKKIEKSWGAIFFSMFMPVLMKLESQFKDFFDSSLGRPNWPVSVLLGILILKHEFDLTDEETVDQFNFNILWHKALGVVSYDCNICRKTIHNFQKKLNNSHKHLVVFNAVVDEIIEKSDIKFNRQRLDSVHIKSNMAELGRVRLFCRTIEMFLSELRERYPAHFNLIDPCFIERYLDREGYFCDPKPSEAKRRIQEVAEELHFLVSGYELVYEITQLKSYNLMTRLLSEQCHVSETFEVELLKNPSTASLQNPSDPDAGYSGHKGKGYQAQVSETCSEENPFEVVTSVKLESANENDSDALLDVIEELESTGKKPQELQADTSYGSQDNVDNASSKHVELIAPVPGTRKSLGINLDDFIFDDQSHRIEKCPNGNSPHRQRYRKKKDLGEAEFDIATQCHDCPFSEECPGKIIKNSFRRVKWKRKNGELAKRRQYQKTPEFKKKYRCRSGIEATFSQLGNTHGGKKLSVRGFSAIRAATFLKFTAINIHRYIKYALDLTKKQILSVSTFCFAKI